MLSCQNKSRTREQFWHFSIGKKDQLPAIRITKHYYPTALRRVQITPKTSTNITRYLYSRGPVRQVFSQRTSDELD